MPIIFPLTRKSVTFLQGHVEVLQFETAGSSD